MKHKSEIDGYSLENLVIQVGDLRYDSLMEFLFLLSKKLSDDSLSDRKSNRKNLASHLMKSSDAVWESAEHIRSAWELSKNHIENGINTI